MPIYEDILFLFISANIFTLSKQIIPLNSVKSTLFIKINGLNWDLNMQEGPIYQVLLE